MILVGRRGEELLSGLMSLLPIGERRKFSFSIGLRPSLRRPVRIVAVPETSLQIERFARQCRYTVVHLNALSEIDYHDNAWASVVEHALEEARFPWLAEQVMAPLVSEIGEGAVAVHDHNAWQGEAWAANVDTAPAPARKASTARAQGAGSSSVAVLDVPAAAATRSPANKTPASEVRAPAKDSNPAARERDRARLHHDLAGNDPESLEMLERLDDLVYDAIAGRPGAFEELTHFWPEALDRLEGEALVESREQYLRYALGLWTQGETSSIQDPQRAMGALDVLCLLFPEGEF